MMSDAGYTIHYRLPSDSWREVWSLSSITENTSRTRLSELPCGTPVHIYATANNQYGVSSASDVIIGRTNGYPPPRPHPPSLVEFNASCVTLRLYTWPERGCAITGWKVSHKSCNMNRNAEK